jgi:hypothetical protein
MRHLGHGSSGKDSTTQAPPASVASRGPYRNQCRRQAEWVAYAKRPFGSAEHVLRYLGRYTHRVAISNNRLISMDNGQVSFLWRDYKQGASKKTMTLQAEEFIRRFLLHVLPEGFKHIRSYGFLANRCRETKLAACRRLLNQPLPPVEQSNQHEDYRDRYERLTGNSLRDCPNCGKGRMLCIETFPVGSPPRAPPLDTS